MLGNKILNSTPILSNVVEASYQSFQEIYSLKEKYQNTPNKNEYNKEALDILLKYSIITPEGAENLVENKKLDIDGVDDIIQKYK